MNKERVLMVADAIEQGSIPGLGFNMYSFLTPADPFMSPDTSGHGCGTVACIGGWTLALRRGYKPSPDWFDPGKEMHDWDEAREWLGLDDGEAFHLFAPHELGYSWKHVTPKIAVGVMRHFAETGEIKWPTYEELENAKEEA